jgi:hypothetical protein
MKRARMCGRVGVLGREMAQTHVKIAEQSMRIDWLSDRVERIERRLDLVEALRWVNSGMINAVRVPA